MFAFHSDSRGEMGERSAAQKRPLPPSGTKAPPTDRGAAQVTIATVVTELTLFYTVLLSDLISLFAGRRSVSLFPCGFSVTLSFFTRRSLSTRVFCLAFWGFAVLSEPGFDMLHLGQVSNRQKHYQFDFTVLSGRSGVMWSSHANSSPREVDWSEYRRSIESKRNLNRNKFNSPKIN